MAANQMVAIFVGADVFVDTDMNKGIEEPWDDAANRMSTGRVSGNNQIADVIRDMAALGKKDLGEIVTEKMCDRAGLCHPVNRDYISQGWIDNDICFLFFVIVYSRGGARFKPIGFVLTDAKINKKQTGSARHQAEQNLYIDIIVADKTYKIGNRMLEYVIEWSKRHLHVSTFALSALPHVLTYYPKVGFQHRDSCYDNAFIEELPQELSDFNRMHPGLPLLANSDPIFERSNPNYAEYEPHRRHIMKLHSLGFTTDRYGRCADPSLTLDEFVAENCGDSGFKMRKCTRLYDDPGGPLFRDPPIARRIVTHARVVTKKGRGKPIGHVYVASQPKPGVGKRGKPINPRAGKPIII